MYQNGHHSPSLRLISSPPKPLSRTTTTPTAGDDDGDVSSLGQVVKKFNGLIDSRNFLQSADKATVVPDDAVPPATATSRSDPIDIPKAGQQPQPQRPPVGHQHNYDFDDDDDFREDPLPSYCEIADPEFVSGQIAEQIEAGIKRAKGTTLDCSEVLIPLNLMRQIAMDIVSSSEVEPTGLRGCLLYVGLEDHCKELRRIGCLRPISQLSNPVPTFELYLTLKEAHSGWLHQVSHKVLKLGRKSLVISDQYQLSKKKLFRSDLFS